MDLAERISHICINFIAKNLNKSEEELEKIDYGLQVLLVNIIKLTILFTIAFFLNVAQYTLVAFLTFAFLRCFASGVHSSSNIGCTITNIILFIGNAFLSKNVVLAKPILISILSVCFILIFIYAPADTEDRPLLSKRIRKRNKIQSIIATILLSIIALFLVDSIYTNLIIFGILEEALFITPFVYFIFNKKYNNYKNTSL